MNKLYAGIGSRKTPAGVLTTMLSFASFVAKRGYTLRSGAADGADTAFEMGCDKVGGLKEIWLPWSNFNSHENTNFMPSSDHELMAESLHPYWEDLKQGVRKLHSRNVGQILGSDLNTPVDFVLCWTPDGCESKSTRTPKTGGTATAIVLADMWNIPVINLNNANAKTRLWQLVKSIAIIETKR